MSKESLKANSNRFIENVEAVAVNICDYA